MKGLKYFYDFFILI